MAYRKNAGDRLIPSLHVPLSSIDRVTDPDHPLFDSRVLEPADDTLVESIATNGFFGALLVRRDGTRYQLIDGRRRHAACLVVAERDPQHRLVTKGVACIVRDVGDEAAYDLMIEANETSKPYTSSQRAHLIQRAVDRGRSMEAAAKPFGLTAAQGYQLVKILRTDDSVQAEVDSGDIHVSAAVALADLPRAEQKQVVKEHKDRGEKLTTDRAKQSARPDGPVPSGVRQKVLRHVYNDRETWKRVTESIDSSKAFLSWMATGTDDAFSFDPELKSVMAEVMGDIRNKKSRRNGSE